VWRCLPQNSLFLSKTDCKIHKRYRQKSQIGE
jgi:hypothetical protein